MNRAINNLGKLASAPYTGVTRISRARELGMMGTRDAYRAAKRKVPLKYKLYGGHIEDIEPWKVVVPTVLTLGLYGFYWQYRASAGVREASHEKQVHPALEILLSVCTLGLFSLWAMFRNARRIHACSLYFRRSHKDLSELLLPLYFFAPFTIGITLLVAMAKSQEQLNDFAQLTGERERARAAGDASTPSLLKQVAIVPISARRVHSK
jgi:Domain of unknown function (DUF4234)